MSCVIVVGAQWGDEGKGKIVDIYTEHAVLVVRAAGGANAGHTLVVGDEKTILRLLPSGILRENTRCVLAQGMVIDPVVLVADMSQPALEDKVRRTGVLAGDLLDLGRLGHRIEGSLFH